MLLNSVFAFEKVNLLLDDDNYMALEKIRESRIQINSSLSDLRRIEKKLEEKNADKKISIKYEKVAGAVVIVGILFASYQVYCPPTLRILLSSFLTLKLKNYGLIQLTSKEVEQFKLNLKKLKNALNSVEMNLEYQRVFHCQTNVPHVLCRK
ncbi:MAG: hypothetical protein HOP07_18085 [Bacteriovoracaceae bacterium]|nr:hypothetical protein [Bacteriovoracaceae bacterium]